MIESTHDLESSGDECISDVESVDLKDDYEYEASEAHSDSSYSDDKTLYADESMDDDSETSGIDFTSDEDVIVRCNSGASDVEPIFDNEMFDAILSVDSKHETSDSNSISDVRSLFNEIAIHDCNLGPILSNLSVTLWSLMRRPCPFPIFASLHAAAETIHDSSPEVTDVDALLDFEMFSIEAICEDEAVSDHDSIVSRIKDEGKRGVSEDFQSAASWEVGRWKAT
jgi:hypothetical protein